MHEPHRGADVQENALDRHDDCLTPRGFRLRKGLSVTKLARLAKIQQGYISLLELGRIRQPRESTLNKLAAALEVDCEDYRAAFARLAGSNDAARFRNSNDCEQMAVQNERAAELYETLENLASKLGRLTNALEVVIDAKRPATTQTCDKPFDAQPTPRMLRARAGMSTYDLCKKSKIRIGQLYRIECGRIANPRMETLFMIAKTLAVNVSEYAASVRRVAACRSAIQSVKE
jgi:transcriptional regulator with XRE-family HTH domain